MFLLDQHLHGSPGWRKGQGAPGWRPEVAIIGGRPLEHSADEDFLALKPLLAERLDRLAAGVRAEQFGSLLTSDAPDTGNGPLPMPGAGRTSVVLDHSGEHLMPALTPGTTPKLVRPIQTAFEYGLICMVFASEQRSLKTKFGRIQHKATAGCNAPWSRPPR